MKNFNAIRNLPESVEATDAELVSENMSEATDLIQHVASRIIDEELANRLLEINEELELYNQYLRVAESCVLNEYDSGLLPAIAESFRTGNTFEYTYPNGEIIEVDSTLSEAIVDIYDNLDEDNKQMFAAIIGESADDLEEILNLFAEELDENEDRIDESGHRPDENPDDEDHTPEVKPDDHNAKQGRKIAKDRKSYLARKAAEADNARKAAGGLAFRLKKEELEGDTNTVSEAGFDKQDRPTKKEGPSHRDLVATAKWMRKNKIDSSATAKKGK